MPKQYIVFAENGSNFNIQHNNIIMQTPTMKKVKKNILHH